MNVIGVIAVVIMVYVFTFALIKVGKEEDKIMAKLLHNKNKEIK